MKTTARQRAEWNLLRVELSDDEICNLIEDLDRALSLLGRLSGLQYRNGAELIACYESLQRDVCEFLRDE